DGSRSFPSISSFFKMVEENLYKIQYRVMLSRFRGKTTCSTCEGLRLRPETEWVKINGHTIQSMIELPLDELLPTIESLKLSDYETHVAKRLLYEVSTHLSFSRTVGWRCLTPNR